MAHRSNQRGSLILKRKFRGVPMIRRAVGTTDAQVVAQVDLMYRALYAQGRIDILESIAKPPHDPRSLHPLQVLSQWRLGWEIDLPSADVLPGLADAWRAWVARLPAGEHRRKIEGTERALRIPDSATLKDLPALFISYKRRASDRPRTVNLARAHCRAFLRDTVGTNHALYIAVKDTRPLATSDREKGTPHSVARILELREKLGPRLGDMLWTMAVTGMGNKEYWTDGFEALGDRVLIHGAKTDHRANRTRDREIPLWTGGLAPPACTEKVFRRQLRTASKDSVLIYDLRRTFARWCEEAHIIQTNRDAYLGHGPRTMTQLYTFGQLPGQLSADAAKLRAYYEASRP